MVLRLGIIARLSNPTFAMTMLRPLLATLLLTLGLVSTAAADTPPPFAEGRHFQRVATPTPPEDPKKITVEEFFWYGCPHCYKLEPQIAAWRQKLPADAVFVRVPDNLGRGDAMAHERAFYVAQMLGIEDQIHRPLMDALVRDGVPLRTMQSMRDFFAQVAHVKAADFTSASDSFIVEANVQRADQLAQNYQITGVPTIVVGGEYLTEINQPGIYDARLGENEMFQRMLDTASFLIDKVREERKAGAGAAPGAPVQKKT
jgi:thiol:disulfide interchange protein DsbA